jgi:S1-C subfamily serine protease
VSIQRRLNAQKALPVGRAFFVWAFACLVLGSVLSPALLHAEKQNGEMTVDEAVRLGEDFGIAVGEVDEEIQKELNLQKPEGVAVFEVIGNSRADYAGIKVRSVIKEIDKQEVRSMLDFGRALKRAMPECNFTVGTYEPADPGDPVGWGVNFHFVGCKRD